MHLVIDAPRRSSQIAHFRPENCLTCAHLGEFGANLVPQLLAQHPAESRKVRGAEHAMRVPCVLLEAVVVP